MVLVGLVDLALLLTMCAVLLGWDMISFFLVAGLRPLQDPDALAAAMLLVSMPVVTMVVKGLLMEAHGKMQEEGFLYCLFHHQISKFSSAEHAQQQHTNSVHWFYLVTIETSTRVLHARVESSEQTRV